MTVMIGFRKIIALFILVLTFSCGGFKGEKYDVEVEVDLTEVPAERRKDYLDAVTLRLTDLGIDQKNIQIRGGTSEVLFVVNGFPLKDTNLTRIAYYFQSSYSLEFHETYNASEILPILVKLNEHLIDTSSLNRPSAISDSSSTNKDFLTTGETVTRADSISILSPFFQYFLLNIMDGGVIPQGAVLGRCIKSHLLKVDSLIEHGKNIGIIPSDILFMWSEKPEQGTGAFYLYAIKCGSAETRILLRGDCILKAEPGFGQLGNVYVALQFNQEGSNKWERLTSENIGREIAIAFDNKVITAPTVQSVIVGGTSQITGDFTIGEVEMLCDLFNSASVPGKPRVTNVTKIKN